MEVGKVIMLEDFEAEGGFEAVGRHLESRGRVLGERLNMAIGFEGCLFEEKDGVVGSVEDIVAREALRLKIVAGQNVKGCVLPAWFLGLMKRSAASDDPDESVPKNSEEIFARSRSIKARLKVKRVLADSEVNQLVDDIFSLDVLTMKWVEFFFKKGTETRFFLERARWFDWYRTHDIRAFTQNAELPQTREEVITLIKGLREFVNVEVHMVTGSFVEVVDAALGIYNGLKADLGINFDRIHASTRGIDRSDGTLSYFGANAMHPLAIKNLMKGLSPSVAVIAERNLRGPVAESVVKGGGVVVGV